MKMIVGTENEKKEVLESFQWILRLLSSDTDEDAQYLLDMRNDHPKIKELVNINSKDIIIYK